MTDKELDEKADCYINNLEPDTDIGIDNSIGVYFAETVKEAYLAGAKDNASQWHKQSEDDIYDCVNDWDIHYFVCIMKNEHRVFATGICDEDYDGNVSQNLYFDDYDEKYNCDDIKWWQEIELPKE